jgi:hypothetical protein
MYTLSVSTTVDGSPPLVRDSVPAAGVSIVTVAEVGREAPVAHRLVLTVDVLA